MAIETERKFLVKDNSFINHSNRHETIKQGYISSVPERTVRIRMKNEKAYITIKGISSNDGTQRFEWEKEIPACEAEDLFMLCEPGKIEKKRYYVPVGKHIFEVDIFEGENEGLVLAEVELQTPDEVYEKPDWLGQEVTGNKKFYNSALSQEPFKSW